MEEVCQEWANLWHRSTARSVFQHPDWLIPWCRPFGVREPWVLLARRGRRLVGVAPFVIYERGSERVLTLLGAGVSDDQGVIIEPGDEQRVMNSIWEYLARHAERFDVCELENLTRESRLLGVPTPAGWQAGSPRRHDVRPVLHLPPATGGLDGLLPRGMLKRVRYAAHQAERTGHPPRFEHVSAANFDELFGALTRLHRARWAARSQPGMLTPDREEFHHEAARRLLARGMLRMHALSLGNHVVAVFYGYHAGTRTVYYLSGFDPEYDTFSPGNLVVAAAIEYSVTHDDARAFDFLRGAEAYKYAWGAADEPLFAIQLRYVGTEEAAHAA
jgi:CelD/BcsL family acetyltransferase involved in cellulose biosynthesis